MWGVDALLDTWPLKRYLLAGGGHAGARRLFGLHLVPTKYWQDSERLYRHAIAVTTDNYIAYDGLGNVLEARPAPRRPSPAMPKRCA